MNTFIRLLVLIPGALVSFFIGLIFLAWSPLTPVTIVAAAILIVSPLALILWTIADHRKRRRAQLKLYDGTYAKN